MNRGKYVFAQISSFLPQRTFDSIVARYKGDHAVGHFTCWNQLMCMMYGQLSSRESLRDLVLTVNAHALKAYHLGFGKSGGATTRQGTQGEPGRGEGGRDHFFRARAPTASTAHFSSGNWPVSSLE